MEEEYRPPIGKEQVRAAAETLQRYRAGKAALERRIIENEEFWRLRHWEHIPERGTSPLRTRSAWLVNVLLSKHADAMDAFPEPACLPRSADDRKEAEALSAIVPVVLAQNDFERTWSDNWWKKLKAGVAFYGVFWDKDACGGRGDVAVTRVDPLSLYWEPGIDDLQKSRNLFHVELADNETLIGRWPQLAGKLRGSAFRTARYLCDETIDTSDKSPVVDWYYKKRVGGQTVLHYVKFVGEEVLYATENEAAAADGLYQHGLYPFFPDVLFPEEGTPAGYGYIDLCKDAQRQIDLMNNAIVANCVAAATPRWLKRGDDGINEEEYADWTRPFVHVQGSIEDSALRQIQVSPLSGNYLNILAAKINELKETSGNRDVNNGGVGGGVTAAAAIAAMQESSGKLSRDQIQNSYRCFRLVVYCVIALIRQFYDGPRQMRITGPAGQPEFLRFDYRAIAGDEPAVLDIEVSAQRQSAYNRLSANEMALQFFQLGFFNPQLTDQALAALEMMDFKGRDAMRRRLEENATLETRLRQAEAELKALVDLIGPAGSRFAGAKDASGPAEGSSPAPRKAAGKAPRLTGLDSLGRVQKQNALAERARARAAAATQPR